jgi:lysophospholipase L1-like esterase
VIILSDFHEHHHPQHCFQYTALGNSIASGVGATNNYGYVNYFRDFLDKLYHCVNLTSRANPGFTSSDLLNHLQHDIDTRKAVKNADIITISIGGADLLNCLHASNIPACLSNADSIFAHNWPQIMSEIRKSIRSHAEIYVMTVYNPFKGDDPNYTTIEFFIQKINRVINKNRSIYHYKVVNVHKDFQGKFTNGQWRVCTWTHFCQSPPDPHPTDRGHLKIARLHELEFLKNHRYKLRHLDD